MEERANFKKIAQLLRDLRWKADLLMAEESEIRAAEETQYEVLNEANWRKAKALVERQWEETQLQSRTHYFQNALREWLINKWLAENTGLSDWEQAQAQTTIEQYLREDRTEELETYLNDVMTFGIKVADRNRYSRLKTRWNWVVYTFLVMRGLIYVIGVGLIFTVPESRFQTVTLAILILIGNMLLGNRTSDYHTRMALESAIEKRFDDLRRFFKLPETEWERQVRVATEVQTEKNNRRTVTGMYINIVCEGIVWLICVGELVVAFF